MPEGFKYSTDWEMICRNSKAVDSMIPQTKITWIPDYMGREIYNLNVQSDSIRDKVFNFF